MKSPASTRGRPRTSPLTRTEQLRTAKRAQRQRQRRAGLTTVELRLPTEQAERLRAAVNTPRFGEALNRFLQNEVLDINEWPVLRELAWNRADRWIPAEEALALYERNWRFVEPERLTQAEADLLDHLKHRFGGGVLNV
ncbi:MAG: hypothetical protein WD750_05550 [Gammaproteobacteria bacterium]